MSAFLTRCGLSCSIGTGIPSVLAALRSSDLSPTRVTLPDGAIWPHHVMTGIAGNWSARLQHAVRQVASQCAASALREVPLFVASSSLDMGMEEKDGHFVGDLSTFADVVASALDWRGPAFSVSNACTSSTTAVIAACDLLRAGDVADAVVIGIEFDNRFSLAGFAAMQLLSPTGAQPFGADRDGLVLGDAVVMLCLSSRPSGWRIAGDANVVQGMNATGVDAQAVATMCRQAMAKSGVEPADIDLIKVHAAGNPDGDAAELAGLRQVFDPLPALVSFKAAIGHTLGAAGATELALLTACVDAGIWPRLHHALDDSLGVQLNALPIAPPRRALLSSIGFGGGHAALVLERCDA